MISGVLAVHNEEDMLRFTLPYFKHYCLDELVVVLDRCIDRSYKLINKANLPYPVRFQVLNKRLWRYQTAEVFNTGFCSAYGDVIYSLAPDCIYNQKIFKIDWHDLDVASFYCTNYPLNKPIVVKAKAAWINTYGKIQNILYPPLRHKPNVSGVYGFRKIILDTFPIPDVPSEDSWLIKQSIKHGYRYHYFNLRNYHLRPNIGNATKYRYHGLVLAQTNTPYWKIIAQSIIFDKPALLKAYLQEKQK